jgi:CRISPR-associated protein Cas2
MLKNRLVKEMNLELDSMRFYYLGSSWKRKIEHIGAKEPLEQEGPLIV